MTAAGVAILYHDGWVVGVRKPSGMLCHRSREAPDRDVLLQAVREQIGQWVYPVHRLDRGTSGIVVHGLSREDARWLQAALQHPEAIKEYLALVRGRPPLFWACDDSLTDENGIKRPARTEFTTERPVGDFTLVRARLRSGRRHQVRRHLDHAAHQIVGDTTYGKGRINRWFRECFGLHRMFLHAERVAFRHAVTGELVEIVDPLPAELVAVLDALSTPAGKAEREPGCSPSVM